MGDQEKFTELEISLHKSQAADTYRVEIRFSDPSSETEISPERGLIVLDLDGLASLHLDAEAYGQALTEQLFDDADLRSLYDRAQTATESAGLRQRLRVAIGSSAPELQSLRWELLRDPKSGRPLSTSERVVFSRFMASRDWRAVSLRPRQELKVLIAVASPTNLAKYDLADIDVDGEVGRLRASLAAGEEFRAGRDFDLRVVGQDEPLTLARLMESLRDGVDVLYLACHGTLHRKTGAPVIFLQDEEGAVAAVPGEELAERLAEIADPPRLAVLVSCESAGTEEAQDSPASFQSSLAPRLAQAGVPAVIAMQGRISTTTIERCMPVFFRELLRDGRIDRAFAVARGEVRDRHDFWMPALFYVSRAAAFGMSRDSRAATTTSRSGARSAAAFA